MAMGLSCLTLAALYGQWWPGSMSWLVLGVRGMIELAERLLAGVRYGGRSIAKSP
jgi:hypothetical protein